MVKNVYKKLLKNQEKLILLTFSFLVLGQIPGYIFDNYLPTTFTVHLLDILLLVTAFIYLPKIKISQMWQKSVVIFILWAMFSYVSSVLATNTVPIKGLFYLLRLVSVGIFLLGLNTYITSKSRKNSIYEALIVIGIFIAIFGWLQYFLVPDLRQLKYLGWDDHLNRLIGTYLDPAFTGIMLVLSSILALNKYLSYKNYKYLAVTFFLIISVGFTYSRASFVSLFAAILMLLVVYSRKKLIIVISALALLGLLILPRPAGEGVRLERVRSVVSRVENYQYSFDIIKDNLVFGVGYNNLCEYRVGNVSRIEAGNSCSGLDNSLLFVLATTGVVGFILFTKLMIDLYLSTSRDMFGKAWLAAAVALIIHSQFANTLFYLWVMVWFCFITAISRKSGSKV